MSHFAELDDNNIVLRVVVGDNNAPNEGLDWIEQNLGGRWIQTSYNENFRKNFAQPGDTYDAEKDAFIKPSPFASWVLNPSTCKWEAPFPAPQNGKDFYWDEDLVNWVEIQGE